MANLFQRFVDAFRRPKEPSARDLQDARAIVDPSRLLAGWNTLPYNPSLLVGKKGLQVFDKMLLDEQVKSAMKFKTGTVLSSGWEIVSPGDKDDSWEVTEFVRFCLENIDGGFHQALEKILSALEYGFSCTEKIYAPIEKGAFKGKVRLKRLSHVRPHFIDLITNPYGELEAIKQSGTPLGQERVFPVKKFAIYTYGGKFEKSLRPI
jgi:hypothetical protein